jgi:hypothetical protein
MIVKTRAAAQGQITILELHGALTLSEAPQLREASLRAKSSLTMGAESSILGSKACIGELLREPNWNSRLSSTPHRMSPE